MQASRQHGAKDNVVAAAALAEHLRPDHVEQDRRGHAQLASRFAHAQGQFVVERVVRFLHLQTAALHVEQAKWRGRLVDISELLAEVGFVAGFANGAGTGDEITVWQTGLSSSAVRPSSTVRISSIIRSSVT
ncbi:hypothetical protein LP419_12785 [Massilia sp. H-1]|nr:hypothetical protein LP419_12785 [Massilia sp. H-1]